MSRYVGNGEKCPHCGITYEDMKTGLTYQDIVGMLWDYSIDPSRWRYKTRGVILGVWHQLKKSLWERHVDVECPAIMPELDDLPF